MITQDTHLRLTILILASTYPRWDGDPEPGFVHELCKRLALQHRVLVACPHAEGAKETELLDGVEITRYRYAPAKWETLVNNGGIVNNLRRQPLKVFLLPSFVIGQFLAAARLFRKQRFDVVHAHWLLPQGLIAALLQRIIAPSVPFAITSHGVDLYALRGRVLTALKRYVGARAAALTVVSSAMRSDANKLGIGCKNITVQPMGIDFEERFTPSHHVVRSVDQMLFVGRLVEKKGLTYLLEAMPAILEARPTVQLKIAGFGPEESALRQQVRRMHLDSAVQFLGPVPQEALPMLYRQAAVFAAPFIRASDGDIEGLGLVVGEAIACHCPVVVGDVPAVKDLIFDAEGGVVCPLDKAALAAAIIKILADSVSASELARRRRIDLERRLAWPAVADGYSQLLRAIARPSEPIAQ